MTNLIRYSVRAGIIAIVLGSVTLAQQPGTTQVPTGNPLGTSQFVPFDQFMTSAAAATFNSAATTKVANPAAFSEMRQHIIDLYQGVQVTHSFVQGSLTYDCIRVEQQPSVRMLGLKGIAAPPAASTKLPTVPPAGVATVLQQSGEASQSSLLPTNGVDRFGNSMACEDHTVPIERTTMEQMSRFPTLRAFLGKSPDATGMPVMPAKPGSASAGGPAPPSLGAHFHDYTYQYVYNLGGNSNINIWDPGVATFWGEVFSLSQVWYVGLSATGFAQTVEAGWQTFPNRLGDGNPHLFVYYTADGYNTTGCYDHNCSAFVQYVDAGIKRQQFRRFCS